MSVLHDRDGFRRATPDGLLHLGLQVRPRVLHKDMGIAIVLHFEHLRGCVFALGVPQAQVEIDDDPHRSSVSITS
jgi:hypothetical protein